MSRTLEPWRDPEDCYTQEEIHEAFDAIVAEDYLRKYGIGPSEEIDTYFSDLPGGSPLTEFYEEEVLEDAESYPALDELRREIFFRFYHTLGKERDRHNSSEDAIKKAQACTERWLSRVFRRGPDKIPEAEFIEETADAFREQREYVRSLLSGQ